MRAWAAACTWLLVAGCAGAPPPPPPPSAIVDAAPVAESADAGVDEAAAPEPSVSAEPAPASVPAAPSPPSTASYEQATSTPEPLGLDEGSIQLTDDQLTAPMRGVLARCVVPPNAKVTIKTAVQLGRAIGVTVLVDLRKPKPPPPPKPKPKQKPKKPSKKATDAAKAEAKMVAQLVACADQAVRALSWPPSRRRDGFTTTF